MAANLDAYISSVGKHGTCKLLI